MNIRNIIEDALEKHPPVVAPRPIYGFGEYVPLGNLKPSIDAREAAQYASKIIFDGINHDLAKERALAAATAQELNDLKASLRLLTK